MSKNEFSDSDKIKIVDKIIDMIPEIKGKRTYIINQILTPKNQVNDEYVLEKITVNNKFYYRDKYKCILDDNGDLVGVWQWDFNSNDFNYFIFDDEKNKIFKK